MNYLDQVEMKEVLQVHPTSSNNSASSSRVKRLRVEPVENYPLAPNSFPASRPNLRISKLLVENTSLTHTTALKELEKLDSQIVKYTNAIASIKEKMEKKQPPPSLKIKVNFSLPQVEGITTYESECNRLMRECEQALSNQVLQGLSHALTTVSTERETWTTTIRSKIQTCISGYASSLDSKSSLEKEKCIEGSCEGRMG